jgi:hypothetical protein
MSGHPKAQDPDKQRRAQGSPGRALLEVTTVGYAGAIRTDADFMAGRLNFAARAGRRSPTRA